MAGDDAAVFHFVNPIARLAINDCVRYKKQRLPFSSRDFLEKVEGEL